MRRRDFAATKRAREVYITVKLNDYHRPGPYGSHVNLTQENFGRPRGKELANSKPGANRAGPHNSSEDESTCDRACAIQALLEYAQALDLSKKLRLGQHSTKKNRILLALKKTHPKQHIQINCTTPVPALETAVIDAMHRTPSPTTPCGAEVGKGYLE